MCNGSYTATKNGEQPIQKHGWISHINMNKENPENINYDSTYMKFKIGKTHLW